MMDSFELTKIAAGVLSALLVIFGVKTMVEINTGAHGSLVEEHAGYTLPVTVGEAGGEAKAAPGKPAFDPAKVAAAVGSADAAAGEGVFKKCASCHTVNSGGANKTGPNLHGVVGRAKASHAGFNYSDVLKGKGGDWTPTDLAAFLHSPKEYAPGTKMSFGGVKDEGDLANLIAYLGTQK